MSEDKSDKVLVKPCPACGEYLPIDRNKPFQLLQSSCGLDILIDTGSGDMVAYQFRPEDKEELRVYTEKARKAEEGLNEKAKEWEKLPKKKTKIVYFAGIPVEVDDNEEDKEKENDC